MTFTDAEIDAAEAQNMSGGVITYLRSQFAAAFLYADRVVDVDALAMIQRSRPRIRPYETAVLLSLYEAVRPALEAGILVLVPELPAEEVASEDDAAKADEDRFDDYLAHRGHRRGRSSWGFLRDVRHAAKIAQRVGPSYFASFPWQWEYVAFLGQSGDGARDVDVAAGLAHVELPAIAGISARQLVAIHQQEDAFVEWRETLRTASRLIRATPGQDTFAWEAADVYREVLIPRIAAVRRATSRSAAIRSAMLEQPTRAALGALFAAGPAAAAGLPIMGILLSAGTGAASNIAYEAVHRPRPGGADAIISMISN